jgi:hypothetical protein
LEVARNLSIPNVEQFDQDARADSTKRFYPIGIQTIEKVHQLLVGAPLERFSPVLIARYRQTAEVAIQQMRRHLVDRPVGRHTQGPLFGRQRSEQIDQLFIDYRKEIRYVDWFQGSPFQPLGGCNFSQFSTALFPIETRVLPL